MLYHHSHHHKTMMQLEILTIALVMNRTTNLLRCEYDMPADSHAGVGCEVWYEQVIVLKADLMHEDYLLREM